MEFILENLAPVAVRQARFERQIHGIQTLLKIGARQLVRMGSGIPGLAAEQKRTNQAVRELAASQKQTAQTVRALAAAQKRTDEAVHQLATDVKELAADVKELAASQKRTDERFQRWLDHGTNARNDKPRPPAC